MDASKCLRFVWIKCGTRCLKLEDRGSDGFWLRRWMHGVWYYQTFDCWKRVAIRRTHRKLSIILNLLTPRHLFAEDHPWYLTDVFYVIILSSCCWSVVSVEFSSSSRRRWTGASPRWFWGRSKAICRFSERSFPTPTLNMRSERYNWMTMMRKTGTSNACWMTRHVITETEVVCDVLCDRSVLVATTVFPTEAVLEVEEKDIVFGELRQHLEDNSLEDFTKRRKQNNGASSRRSYYIIFDCRFGFISILHIVFTRYIFNYPLPL